MSPKITLEKLAEMIQAQFASFDEQLKEIKNTMATMATREETNDRLSSLEIRLTNQIDQLRDSVMMLKAAAGIR